MEDYVTVHSGTTPEYVALQLMLLIMESEDLSVEKREGGVRANKDYILSTYRECLRAVRAPVTTEESAPPPPRRG